MYICVSLGNDITVDTSITGTSFLAPHTVVILIALWSNIGYVRSVSSVLLMFDVCHGRPVSTVRKKKCCRIFRLFSAPNKKGEDIFGRDSSSVNRKITFFLSHRTAYPYR